MGERSVGFAEAGTTPRPIADALSKLINSPHIQLLRPERPHGNALSSPQWLNAPDTWDALMFWQFDRFVRCVSDFAEMIKWCQSRDKNLVSATETIDIRSPIGRVIAYIVSAFAETEAEATRERVIGSHDYLRRNGRWGGGLAPHGYQAEPIPGGKGVRLVEDPDAAPIVNEIVRRSVCAAHTDRLGHHASSGRIGRHRTSNRHHHQTGEPMRSQHQQAPDVDRRNSAQCRIKQRRACWLPTILSAATRP
ncbi:recombinase family protein [Streptomyces sp. 3N207]|uniref:recombinase family protein n=1 Tax=Streptomyces sp. 3N207 TaxID=3457417 RepID=UPI003FD08E78